MPGTSPLQNESDDEAIAPSEAKDTWVFVSFRNDDEPWAASLIADALHRKYPKHLFYQHRKVAYGSNVRKMILAHAKAAKVIIAVIGENWVGKVDIDGKPATRRIDEKNDLVRREIATGLKNQKNCRVIPVLVKQSDKCVDLGTLRLPRELKTLAGLDYIEASPRDTDKLLAAIYPSVDDHLKSLGILDGEGTPIEQVPVTRLPMKRVPIAAAGCGGIASVVLATTASCLEILPLGLISLIYGFAAYWDSRVGR